MVGCMRLHRLKAYSRGGKDYFSWKVNLPPEDIEEMGWEHGQELEAVQRKDGLLLRPARAEED